MTSSTPAPPAAWAPYQTYAVGAVVTYDGLTYQALQEETSNPSWDPVDAVTLWAVVPAGTTPPAPTAQPAPAPWSATAIYTAGMIATVDGVAYEANWWTQDNNPLSNSGPSGSGQPWTLVPTASLSPAPPTDLTASAITSTTAVLQWQASAAPANQTISGYAVYENGVQIGTTTSTSYTVANLTAATTYAFAIAELDSAGSSAETSPLSVTTGTDAAQGGSGRDQAAGRSRAGTRPASIPQA